MSEIFMEIVTTATFFGLHSLIVLATIWVGLSLHRLSERFFDWQKQRAMKIFLNSDRR